MSHDSIRGGVRPSVGRSVRNAIVGGQQMYIRMSVRPCDADDSKEGYYLYNKWQKNNWMIVIGSLPQRDM